MSHNGKKLKRIQVKLRVVLLILGGAAFLLPLSLAVLLCWCAFPFSLDVGLFPFLGWCCSLFVPSGWCCSILLLLLSDLHVPCGSWSFTCLKKQFDGANESNQIAPKHSVANESKVVLPVWVAALSRVCSSGEWFPPPPPFR